MCSGVTRLYLRRPLFPALSNAATAIEAKALRWEDVSVDIHVGPHMNTYNTTLISDMLSGLSS